MKVSTQLSAFALVEVIIALSIATYALVGIIGLLSVAHSGSYASTNETVLVMIVRGAISDLRQERFSTLAQQASAPTPTTYYFDASGRKIGNAGSGAPPDAVYRCTQIVQVDTSTIASGSPHLLRVRLQLSWPASVPVPANTKTIYVDLAGN